MSTALISTNPQHLTQELFERIATADQVEAWLRDMDPSTVIVPSRPGYRMLSISCLGVVYLRSVLPWLRDRIAVGYLGSIDISNEEGEERSFEPGEGFAEMVETFDNSVWEIANEGGQAITAGYCLFSIFP